MAQGIPGADSSIPVTPQMIQRAANIFGQTPKYWGRYFKSPTAQGNVEYRHQIENPVLAQANIRLLPVGRQTGNVHGSQAQGATDAQLNASDFLATFPQELLVSQGGQFLMFLDVEGLPQEGSPSLSQSYYTGWAQTLVDFSRARTNNAVTLLPCVYARRGDSVTWEALVATNAKGITCHGAWVARYPKPGVCHTREWDNSIVIPTVPLPFKVLIWQYDEECNDKEIDLNQTNPHITDIQDELLSKLVQPVA